MAFYAKVLVWSLSQDRYIQPNEVIDLSRATPEEIESLLRQGVVREEPDEARTAKGKVKTDGANN